MALDGRTPVLVGAAAIQQREEDPGQAEPALLLMARALEAAADDAGCPDLLAGADAIRAPRGFWGYGDPGRFLADRFGATVRSQVAEVGVLQTTLFGKAAADIAAGSCDLVLLTGAEAKFRSLRGQILGAPVDDLDAPGEPDEVLRPSAEIMSPLEIQHGLGMPVAQYAMIENALGAAEGKSQDEHRDEIAALWAGMSEVAATNPDAWDRTARTSAEIREPLGKNRMLAFPYTKLHNSQWNVDQASGLILCSLERAQKLGIHASRFIYPLAVADNNTMISLSQRGALHRSPGFHHAGRAVAESSGIEPAAVAHRELYSCFPSAVRVQQRELGLDLGLPVTLTGGMTFGGGPLNNFVLQALAKMVECLRENPGDVGMVNAVSGLLTKQGVSLWSTGEPERPFRHDDVSEATRKDLEQLPIQADASGEATIATYTVASEGEASPRSVVIADLPGGERTVASTTDPEVAAELVAREACGRRISIQNGSFELD
jgi:acetyl-CoA C-acetyltransferase